MTLTNVLSSSACLSIQVVLNPYFMLIFGVYYIKKNGCLKIEVYHLHCRHNPLGALNSVTEITCFGLIRRGHSLKIFTADRHKELL